MVDPIDVEAFVDDLSSELVAGASEEVRGEILSNDALSAQVLIFLAEAKDGLGRVAARVPGATYDMAKALRARKTAIIAACRNHVFQIENLVAEAVRRVVAQAREVETARRRD